MSTPKDPSYPDEPAEEELNAPPQQLKVTMKMRSTYPIAAYVLGGITILVYGLQLLSQMLFQQDYPLLLGLKANELIVKGQYWRLITPVLLHGSILHIGLNMWMLYILGRTMEPHYGHKRFVLLYLISAFAGNVFSFLLSDKYALGAATALFGILTAEGVMILQNRAAFGERGRSMLIQIAVITALNLGIGMIPGFDSWGGLGGVLGGLAFAWFAGPLWGVRTGLFEVEIEDVRGEGNAWRVFLVEVLVLSALVAQRILLQ